MADAASNHVVVCGLGRLGFRLVEQLLDRNIPVVAIEKSRSCPYLHAVQSRGVVVLLEDMQDEGTLIAAGVPRARAVVIATNNDMANFEVALAVRRLNPAIRLVLRLFDQQIAPKIAEAFAADALFSTSAMAAPLVAAQALGCTLLSESLIANVPHVSAELTLTERSPLAGRRIADVEQSLTCRILARAAAGDPLKDYPPADAVLQPGDRLVVHCRAATVPALSAE